MKHIDDLIYDTKGFIKNLARVQDQEYATLADQLALTTEGEEWLFDYVFNCDEPETFEEYLDRHGKTFGEMH